MMTDIHDGDAKMINLLQIKVRKLNSENIALKLDYELCKLEKKNLLKMLNRGQ